MLRAAQSLAAAGFRLALDDFGTGYGSLVSLRMFPARTIKIDGSFVQRMHENLVDLSIVRRTIQLIHDLGMMALAEGVETKQQHQTLLSLGCDAFQGYLFHRPVTADAFANHWLVSSP